MANVTSLAFIHILLSEDGGEDVKVHTGLGSPYPDTSPWSDYVGAGGLLGLSAVNDSAETSATEYELRFALPGELETQGEVAALFESIRERDLQAVPVCIHAVDITALQQGAPPEPSLLLLGRINRLDLTPSGIVAHIYTPAALLNKVVGAVTRLNELEHRRYVDSTDQALRFITDTSLTDVYFP